MDKRTNVPMDIPSDKASFKVAGERPKREKDWRDCDKMLLWKSSITIFGDTNLYNSFQACIMLSIPPPGEGGNQMVWK